MIYNILNKIIALRQHHKPKIKMGNLLNKKYYTSIRRFTKTIFVLNAFAISVFAHTDSEVVSTPKVFNDKTTMSEIQTRMDQLVSIIDIEVTPEVQERINQYTYHSRRNAEKLLNRVMIYFPIFEREIQRRGMPDEIKYLAVVESMLKPNATSQSGAAGLWQFVPNTAKMVGLEVSSVVDERRSIEKSTQAAMDYLQSLYDRFEDWNLALAAYNCGPGNVSKAMKRSKSKDFWEIRKNLPKETQKYLPRFIAAMYLLNYYHYHGFNLESVNPDFSDVTTLPIKKKIYLSTLSKDLGVDYNTLRKLNPEYLQGYIPASQGKYSLRIPSSHVGNYYKKYDPETYNKMQLEKIARAEKEAFVKQQAERRLGRIEELTKDTIQPLEQIVSIIFNSIHSISGRKTYHIPRQMRSLESVLRKV